MNDGALRSLIQQKLADGRLPNEGVRRVMSGPGDGERCEACELPVEKDQLVEDVVLARSARVLHLHMACLRHWAREREALEVRVSA